MHCMIDIETLSTQPTAAILSIGAVKFDHQHTQSEEFYARIGADHYDTLPADYHRDASTLRWWDQQSHKVREEAFYGDTSLNHALHHLHMFVAGSDTVWANSPSFDLVILEHAYRCNGMSPPWTHRNQRDMRTLKDLAQLPVPENPELHSAIADARHQALYVIQALDHLLTPRTKLNQLRSQWHVRDLTEEDFL